MRRLKDDRMVQHNPTMYAHSEELVLGNVRFKAYDLGGHEAMRKAWKNYYASVDGIIYLIDSADKERFEESRKELEGIFATPEVAKVPIVVFGSIYLFKFINIKIMLFYDSIKIFFTKF